MELKDEVRWGCLINLGVMLFRWDRARLIGQARESLAEPNPPFEVPLQRSHTKS